MKETIKTNANITADARLKSLKQWLLTAGYTNFELKPASQDASFRRYFRMTRWGEKSLIIMDAPPQNESLSPFIEIAQDWSESKISVPEIFEYSRALGFLVLEDFGNTTFLNVLSHNNTNTQYQHAIDELILIQKHVGKVTLPAYTQELLLFEMSLFVDWFVVKHCEYALLTIERDNIEQSFNVLMQSALKQKSVTVHRDYHSRNLMLATENKLGVIDFQDAVRGPITYDLVSLLKDCYFKLNQSNKTLLLDYYFQQAIKAQLIENNDFEKFQKNFELMGIQRHLKAIGIFCRLFYRDGKENYLADIPLTASYITELGGHYEVLDPIISVLEKCMQGIKSANR